MVYCFAFLSALLAWTVLLLAWKVALMRRSARELERGIALCLEEETNTLLSIPSRDRAMRSLAASLNGQLRLLRQERQRCQAGDRTLKEAVRGVSHDLRTPLTAISGYLDLLEREEKSLAAERYLALVRERTDHLAELTDSFFRYSMGRSPEAPGPVGDVCLNRALEESLAAWYAVLTRRGIVPEVSMPERQVVRRLDSAALSRIFGNILSNAVKYSAGDLRAELTEDGTVTFANSAPGMTSVLAEKLFDRYFTVETGRGSTGLGLSIARQLAEEMGGTVTAACEDEILCVRVRFP